MATIIAHEWSHDQIKGQLISECFSIVCATTIYDFIQQDRALGAICTNTIVIENPTKSVRAELRLKTKLSGDYQSIKGRLLWVKKSA